MDDARELAQRFRFQRVVKLDEAYPEIPKQDGKRFCRRCRSVLTGRRLTWCSMDCVYEAQIRCTPSVARRFVFRRDLGVCAVCRLDTEAIRQAFEAARMQSWRETGTPLQYDRKSDVYDRLRALGLEPARSWWEADHVVPVVEGGGFCGLDGLRTLCLACHKRVTAELAARRAKRRKESGDGER